MTADTAAPRGLRSYVAESTALLRGSASLRRSLGFWLAIGLYVVGGITSFIGYLGALIKMAQLEQWLWFILLLVFSGITMLVYIFVGPETRAGSQLPTYAHSG